MSALAKPARSGAPLFERLKPDLLGEPLEFLFADHFRQRVLCTELRRLAAEGQVGVDEASEIAHFLRVDMLLHHQDEELDLFPALKRRVQPEDNLESVLERLAVDHHDNEPVAAEIARAMTAPSLTSFIDLSDRTRKKMLVLANSEHRHLAIENGLVMTLARVRLTRADLARMSENMQARRALRSRG